MSASEDHAVEMALLKQNVEQLTEFVKEQRDNNEAVWKSINGLKSTFAVLQVKAGFWGTLGGALLMGSTYLASLI